MSAPAARKTGESNQTLWLLTVGPGIWSVHFMLCYITAAVWCAKSGGRDASLGTVRVAIAAYTIVAVVGIGLSAWGGWKRHKLGSAETPHDRDTAADRHRFLGFSTFLLSSLSLIATLMEAIVVFFFNDCR